MKSFFVALFSLSSIVHAALESDRYFSSFWNGTEDELYYNVTLSEGLVFSDEYYILSTSGGQGAEIICEPISESPMVSKSGQEVKEIRITIMLDNMSNPNKISFTETTNIVYFDTADYYESKKEGELKNPAIDLSQDPEFFTIAEAPNEGVVAFKNSFPYSQLGKKVKNYSGATQGKPSLMGLARPRAFRRPINDRRGGPGVG